MCKVESYDITSSARFEAECAQASCFPDRQHGACARDKTMKTKRIRRQMQVGGDEHSHEVALNYVAPEACDGVLTFAS